MTLNTNTIFWARTSNVHWIYFKTKITLWYSLKYEEHKYSMLSELIYYSWSSGKIIGGGVVLKDK